MRYSYLIAVVFFQNLILLAQPDSSFFNSYLVLIHENLIQVKNDTGELVFNKQFSKPYAYQVDVDADSIDEFIVVDSTFNNGYLNFYIYLFSGFDEFQIIDSIYSGSFFPFITYSEEIESMVIETGNPSFEIFNQSAEVSTLPINIWKLENGVILPVNDELYDPFIFENNNLVQLLDFYTKNLNDCSVSKRYKGIIASAFTNYFVAGEQSLAYQLLKKYYHCDDIEVFKQQILGIIYPEAKQ
ncbi:MAG: hypothetical protein HXY50_09640 [Ignavibacteriaceae bacterium]|nr:hypothetical protein [Ignavibacteriaceae bacterium]